MGNMITLNLSYRSRSEIQIKLVFETHYDIEDFYYRFVNDWELNEGGFDLSIFILVCSLLQDVSNNFLLELSSTFGQLCLCCI